MKYGSDSGGGGKMTGSAKSLRPNGKSAKTSTPGGKTSQSTYLGMGSVKTNLTQKMPSNNAKRLPGT